MSLKPSNPSQHTISSTEQTAYAKLFALADSSKQGIITPPIAVAFLSKSKLPQETLGKVDFYILYFLKDRYGLWQTLKDVVSLLNSPFTKH